MSKMTAEELFNIRDTTDVPFEVGGLTQYDKIMDIFEAHRGSTISTPELRVAYYRMYNEEIGQSALGERMNKLVKDKRVERVKHGTFLLPESTKE